MKPRHIIISAVSIATIFATAVIFLDTPSDYSKPKFKAPPSIEIKWGEGSEAGVPSAATNQ